VSLLNPHVKFDVILKIIVKMREVIEIELGSSKTKATLLTNLAIDHVMLQKNKFIYHFE
jgi:hypothetical protein